MKAAQKSAFWDFIEGRHADGWIEVSYSAYQSLLWDCGFRVVARGAFDQAIYGAVVRSVTWHLVRARHLPEDRERVAALLSGQVFALYRRRLVFVEL